MPERKTNPIKPATQEPPTEVGIIPVEEKMKIRDKVYRTLDERQMFIQRFCKEQDAQKEPILITNIHAEGSLIVADGFDVSDPDSATYGTPLSWQVNVGGKHANDFINSTEYKQDSRKAFIDRYIVPAKTVHIKWHGYLSNGVQFRSTAQQYLPQWNEMDPASHVVNVNYTVIGAEKTLRPHTKEYSLKEDGRKQVIDTTSRLLGSYRWENLQNIIMDGHSMGGNIAFWVSYHENELMDAIRGKIRGDVSRYPHYNIEYRYKTPVIGGRNKIKGHVKVLEGKGELLRLAARSRLVTAVGSKVKIDADFLHKLTDEIKRLGTTDKIVNDQEIQTETGEKMSINEYLVEYFIQPHGYQLQDEKFCTAWQVDNDPRNFNIGTKELEETEDIRDSIKRVMEDPTRWRNHPFARVIREGRAVMFTNINDPILGYEEEVDAAKIGMIPQILQPDVHFNTQAANSVYKALTTGDWSQVYTLDGLLGPSEITNAIYYKLSASESPKEGYDLLCLNLPKIGWINLMDTPIPSPKLPESLSGSEARQIFASLREAYKRRMDQLNGMDATEQVIAIHQLQTMIPLIRPVTLNSRENIDEFATYLVQRIDPMVKPEKLKLFQQRINYVAFDRNPIDAGSGLGNYWETVKMAFPELTRYNGGTEFQQIETMVTDAKEEAKYVNHQEWNDSLGIVYRIAQLIGKTQISETPTVVPV
jgi:hypothetical protein